MLLPILGLAFVALGLVLPRDVIDDNTVTGDSLPTADPEPDHEPEHEDKGVEKAPKQD